MQRYLFVFFVIFYLNIFSCTTILVTKGASVNGSVIVAHSDDDELGDQRIVYVPAKNHKKGKKRNIYPNPSAFPRYVGKDRGGAYNIKGYPKSKPIGSIDEVAHTYAYFDANYGVVNQHQLAIGECTDSGKYTYEPSKKVLLNIGELSRIALERCKKAVDAIKIMGELAEKYGYYDEGETLLVADTEEGWVFEITASPKGTGALWVAKKVPDGEVFVAANEFRIREVDPDDSDMMYSTDLFKVAEKMGWWSPESGERLDWLKSVSQGEYNHPYYSLRRVWRVQSKINPGLKLSPWVEDGYTKEYPFSIKPEKKLSTRDVMNLYRDHYEGTEFDMAKGVAAGPFSYPQRYVGTYDLIKDFKDKKVEGAWERPISVFYCGYVYVTELRGWLPDDIGAVTWIGYDEPYNTCFVPFYVGVNDLPNSYQTGSTSKFSKKTAWWAFNFVSNWAALKYGYMTEDIKKIQDEIEGDLFGKQGKIEKKALALYKKNPKLAKKFLTNYCFDNADKVLDKWWKFSEFLIEKYVDGYISKPNPYKEVGYPKWWRDRVGYSEGPTSYEKAK